MKNQDDATGKDRNNDNGSDNPVSDSAERKTKAEKADDRFHAAVDQQLYEDAETDRAQKEAPGEEKSEDLDDQPALEEEEDEGNPAKPDNS